MKNRNELLIVATAILFAGSAALAQSPALTAPNNSAGSPLDAPPHVQMRGNGMSMEGGLPSRTENSLSAFDKLDTARQGYVTREEINRLPNAAEIPFDRADMNHDGHLDANEFQSAWQGNDGGN
jgi:hypothetical protein